MARAKEEENLQAIASLEERHEKQLRLQARQRHDMEKRRMLNQDEDDKFIRLLDHGYNKQATADERLRTIAKEREAAIDAKRDKFTAKRQAILAAVRARLRPPSPLAARP